MSWAHTRCLFSVTYHCCCRKNSNFKKICFFNFYCISSVYKCVECHSRILHILSVHSARKTLEFHQRWIRWSKRFFVHWKRESRFVTKIFILQFLNFLEFTATGKVLSHIPRSKKDDVDLGFEEFFLFFFEIFFFLKSGKSSEKCFGEMEKNFCSRT